MTPLINCKALINVKKDSNIKNRLKNKVANMEISDDNLYIKADSYKIK